jgi:hypothetical protein
MEPIEDGLTELDRAGGDVLVKAQAITYAIGNIASVRAMSESYAKLLLADYDVVFAVWLDGPTVQARQIKGPAQIEVGMKLQGLPVASGEEAERWRRMIGPPEEAAPARPALTLAWNADAAESKTESRF